MEKIQVKDELKQKYLGLVQGAQQMEQALGAAEYRVYKMKGQRSQIDVELKTWWDDVATEYKLDKGLDYYVDNEGNVNQTERPAPPVAPPEAPVAPVDPDAAPVETATNEEAQAMVDSGEATIPEEAVLPASAPEDNKEGGTAADLT